MQFDTMIPLIYRKGELSTYTFVRAGDGWDFHQGPLLHSFSDNQLFMCWGAYDNQECNNDGVLLYSTSLDNGETWTTPQVWMASPNAVVSHAQLLQLKGTDEALMVYREGHYYGAKEDRRLKINTRWADYSKSPMFLLQRRSLDCGYTWMPPEQIDPSLVMETDSAIYYGAPEQLIQLSNGNLLLLVCYMDAERRSPQHFNIAVLLSKDQGHSWEKTWDFTVPEERGAMEPSVVETQPGQLYGVIRNKSGFIYEIRSENYGESWDTPHKTTIPTVESMAKLLKLANGRLLMVWNNQSSPTQSPRHPLVAAVSADNGLSWSTAKPLADELGMNQLSNFNMLQTIDGRILVCTSHYHIQAPCNSDLDMLIFDEEWLVPQLVNNPAITCRNVDVELI